MSPALRPRVRIPLWAAVTLVAAVYVLRSVVRGWDFRPELPLDALLLGVLVVLIAVRLLLERSVHGDRRRDNRPRDDRDD